MFCYFQLYSKVIQQYIYIYKIDVYVYFSDLLLIYYILFVLSVCYDFGQCSNVKQPFLS